MPGDDPNEVAKPLAPPPTMTQAAAQPSIDNQQDEGPKDPLAAMMAPPSRTPSSLRRPAGGAARSTGMMPGGLPPGMMPPMPPGAATPAAGRPQPAAGAPPSFAVFTPKPAAKKEDE